MASYTPGLPKLRVRTGTSYYVPFVIDLGQRNATFVKRTLTPLRRFLPWTISFAPLPEWDYDITHSFNGVPVLTRRPYLITFESVLPRLPAPPFYVKWLNDWLHQRLLEDQCVALLAMSQYAMRQFQSQNRNFAEIKKLESKMEVRYPGIPLHQTVPKKQSEGLKLLFVGADFMRKGGPALLRAHRQLRRLGVPVETTIVSKLRWKVRDYIGPPSADYVLQATAELKQEGITHYAGLPNADVLRLMKEADYFVFPTIHDTFGYAPLEALACGTPVISTNTCVQPEIVADGVCGYLLPFENDEFVGKWRWSSQNHHPDYLDIYDSTIERLSEAITERLMLCWESRDGYEAMSAAAIEQVQTRFNHEEARNRLEQLYELCRTS